MAGAKYTEVYQKVSAMGTKLKSAGKSGPNNDEQLQVRLLHCVRIWECVLESP